MMIAFLLWILKRIFLLSIYIAIQYALYKRTVSHFAEHAGGEGRRERVVKWAKAFFIGISLPLIFYLIPNIRLKLPTAVVIPLMFPLEIWMPSSLVIFFLLVGMDALMALTRRGRGFESAAVKGPAPSEPVEDMPAQPQRRRFIRTASGLLATTPIATFTYGMTVSKTNFKVERVVVSVKNLPKSLEGLRICQLTDIHYESFLFPEDLAYVVQTANELNPDLIFLTGDFLTEQREMAQPFIEVFCGLKAKEGIYGVFGNHEDYTRTHEIFTRGFKKGGIEMLRDQMTDLRLRGETLRVAGIDWVGHKLRPRAVQTINRAGGKQPTILLSHQPNIFPVAATAGIDLTVSGHTHGGQIAFELGEARISLSQLISPYSAGLYKKGDANLYVSRGIGTIALPLRFNAPPEITLLELAPAGASGQPFTVETRRRRDRV